MHVRNALLLAELETDKRGLGVPINEPHDNHVKRGRKLVKTESRTWQVPGRERERERDGGRIHNGSFDAGAKC